MRVIKSRRMRWAEHVAYMGKRRGIYTGFCWENLRERPRHRWEDIIKMDLQEVRCEGMDWMKLSHDRDGWWALVNAVMNLQVP